MCGVIFFLDRWRRSGVIRMSAAAARVPTALKFRHSCLALGSLFPRDVVESCRDPGNETVDLADFAPNVPCGMRSHDFRLLGT